MKYYKFRDTEDKVVNFCVNYDGGSYEFEDCTELEMKDLDNFLRSLR